MRILISADMEGISGVVDPSHVDPSSAEYQRFRRIMTADVNAAIRGAFAGGAAQVLVSDAHASKTNILVEEIDERAELNSGRIAPFSMMQGVEEGFDAAFFVGYHARMGAEMAILAHTINGSRVANVWLNERITGEFGLNAALAGHFGTPVILVTSDLAGCQEAAEWAPGIEQVITKSATSRHSARCLAASASQKLIEQGARKAVERLIAGQAPAPVKVSAPVKLVLEFMHPGQADVAAAMPGVARIDGRKVTIPPAEMPEAYLGLRAAINVANA
jgi:D-amino peptidase